MISEIQIELDVFSTVPNPSWTVESTAPEFSSVKAILVGASGSALSTGLGYRGFIVKTVFTSGVTVTHTFGKGGQASTAIETALLNSNGGVLNSDTVSIVQAGIDGSVSNSYLF